MSTLEGLKKIGIIGDQSLYFDPATSQYAVKKHSEVTGGPKPIDRAAGEAFLKKLGLTPKNLSQCQLGPLSAATDAIAKARRHITSQTERGKEPDSFLIEQYKEEAEVAYRQACGDEPTVLFAEQLESPDASIQVATTPHPDSDKKN
ncbi:MAG: hypothetical protein Q7T11_09450 [Deltaproteobacteria bacterium]|nr:hypothetical protein [Deltaproteobacteria bacterium]